MLKVGGGVEHIGEKLEMFGKFENLSIFWKNLKNYKK